MKELKLIGIALLSIMLAGFFENIVYGEYDHVDDCTVCHYGGQDPAGYIASLNLVLIRNEIEWPPSNDRKRTVFEPYVVSVPYYDGMREVCLAGTACHPNQPSAVFVSELLGERRNRVA